MTLPNTPATPAAGHAIVAVQPFAATEAGALDGFEAICSCGHVVRASLQGLAVQWGREHAAYMNRRLPRWP